MDFRCLTTDSVGHLTFYGMVYHGISLFQLHFLVYTLPNGLFVYQGNAGDLWGNSHDNLYNSNAFNYWYIHINNVLISRFLWFRRCTHNLYSTNCMQMG